MISGIDISSYQPADPTQLIAQYFPAHVVCKLYLPLGGEAPLQVHSRSQLQIARALGCTVGGYVWCYGEVDPRWTVEQALILAHSADISLPVLWLDCETYLAGGRIVDVGPTPAWLHTAVDHCFALGVPPAIYTGRWWWQDYTMQGNAEFGHVPLWASQYDGIADLATVRLFGGWEHTGAAGKQFTSTPIDQNVFDESVTGGSMTDHEKQEIREVADRIGAWGTWLTAAAYVPGDTEPINPDYARIGKEASDNAIRLYRLLGLA